MTQHNKIFACFTLLLVFGLAPLCAEAWAAPLTQIPPAKTAPKETTMPPTNSSTPKEVRPQHNESTAPLSKAYFAGGCFWGVEDSFQKLPGVVAVVSGYSGGSLANPRYEDVSTGRTGHAETVEVLFDPEKVSYETLARLFFEIHDPTQRDRQGPDVGTQYRSAVFYTDATQKSIAESLIAQLQKKGWEPVTQVAPVGTFFPAEDYHQDFTARTGRGACHMKVPRFEQSPSPVHGIF